MDMSKDSKQQSRVSDEFRQSAEEMFKEYGTVFEMLAAYDRGEIDEKGNPLNMNIQKPES